MSTLPDFTTVDWMPEATQEHLQVQRPINVKLATINMFSSVLIT